VKESENLWDSKGDNGAAWKHGNEALWYNCLKLATESC
jgi:hypothetical protein